MNDQRAAKGEEEEDDQNARIENISNVLCREQQLADANVKRCNEFALLYVHTITKCFEFNGAS